MPKTAKTPAKSDQRLPPVRVKLRRIHANLAAPYPPDGEGKIWWVRLKRALGTTSSAFVSASLTQLQAAARLPCSGISETAINAALAMIEGATPRDETEGALALQMACTHLAAISVLSRVEGAHGTERKVMVFASAAAVLLRTYTAQLECLRRLRHGGDRSVRVEQVHVSDGGQAVIGNLQAHTGNGDRQNSMK